VPLREPLSKLQVFAAGQVEAEGNNDF